MQEARHRWDFFIAHAGADKTAAEELYDLLAPQTKVFLDSRCLLLGDDWDQKLASAQNSSLVTVVLISSNTNLAYYQREEIAAAIDMARKNEDDHRVVPVYLDALDLIQTGIPYGLRLKHGIRVEETGGLANAAQQLLELLVLVKNLGPSEQRIVISQRAALTKVSQGSAKERFDGTREIMKFFGPLVMALLFILLLLLVLILICLVTQVVQENRMLAVAILASMFALALSCLMLTFMKSMTLAQAIAQGGIEAK